MTSEISTKFIEQLEFARLRPAMMMGRVTIEATMGFTGGLHCIWNALGVPQTFELRSRATRNRGWPYTSTGGRNAMEAKGLTEAQIVDELLLIEIEMLKLCAKALEDSSANTNL